MKIFKGVFVSFILFVFTTNLFAGSDNKGQPFHWSYEGECGPDHWGELIHEYNKCEVGDMQSPVGITVTEKAHLKSINFHYFPTPLKIINNGHTIQINYGYGSIITIGNKKYELVQFHFHTPSEHKIRGKSYDMEAHLVHKGEHGELAVVGVLIEEGKENAFINTIWRNFPNDVGKTHTMSDIKICASQLLPKNTTSYFTYTGSLTTPPCTEGVNWFILKEPIQASHYEVNKFVSLFKIDARPVQPLRGRVVMENE